MTRHRIRILMLATLACAPAARAQVAVVDNFESGSLAGWTVGNRNQAAILAAANVNGAAVTPPGGTRFLAISTGPGDRGGGAFLYDDNTINDFDLTTIARTVTYDFGASPAVLAFDWTMPSGEQDQDLQYDDVFDVRVIVNGGAQTQVFARSTCRTGSRSNYPDAPCTTGNATLVNAAPITGTALRFGVGPFQRACVHLPGTATGPNTVNVRFAVADQGDSGFDTAAFVDDVEIRASCDIVADATLRQITTTPATFNVQVKGSGLEARAIASRRLAADATGNNVAFASTANLTGDNPNAVEQLYFHNGSAFTRLTAHTATPNGGLEAIQGVSLAAATSPAAAARWIAYAARANATDNLEIYRLDRNNGAITATAGCSNGSPSITDNATFVAYESDCAGETGVAAGVKRVVYRQLSNNYATVVRPMGTTGPTGCYGRNPAFARGATHLAFESTCQLVAANADGSQEIFRYQIFNASYALVSADTNATAEFAQGPTISADGRYVLYIANNEQDNVLDGAALNDDDSYEVIRWDGSAATNQNRSQLTNGTQLVLPIAARIAPNGAYYAIERYDVLANVTSLVRRGNTAFANNVTERLVASADGFLGGWGLGSDPTTASIAIVPFGTDENIVPPGNADGNPEIYTARVPQ